MISSFFLILVKVLSEELNLYSTPNSADISLSFSSISLASPNDFPIVSLSNLSDINVSSSLIPTARNFWLVASCCEISEDFSVNLNFSLKSARIQSQRWISDVIPRKCKIFEFRIFWEITWPTLVCWRSHFLISPLVCIKLACKYIRNPQSSSFVCAKVWAETAMRQM